jgi:FKBP-type peptidyl-prolyl cis-trans isomerase
MKPIFCGVLIFFGITAFSVAEGLVEETRKDREKVDMSYAFGMVVASDLLGTGLDFNYGAFTRGMRAVLERGETRYTMTEAMDMIQAAFQAAQAERGERNLVEGAAFLAENGRRPGVVTTRSGLQYEAILEGAGVSPAAGDVVLVHYRGATTDGAVFDATFGDGGGGEPVEIPLDHVIPGWSEGLRMMREGGRAKLYIPPELAYGRNGAGSGIGPNSVLVFEVELIAIIRPERDD